MSMAWTLYLVTAVLFAAILFWRLRSSGLCASDRAIAAVQCGMIVYYIPFFLLGGGGLWFGTAWVKPTLMLPIAALLSIWIVRLPMGEVVGRPWRAALPPTTEDASLGRSARCARFITIASGIIVVPMILLQFPRGTEPNAYHLPLAVWVMQSASLDFWDRLYVHPVPHNASLIFAAILGTGWERLVGVSSILMLGMLLVVMQRVAYVSSENRDLSILLACGIASIPMVAFGALESSADIGMMLFAGISLYMTLLACRGGSIPLAIMGGLASGLCAGFKTSGIIYFGLIAVLPMLLCSLNARALRLVVPFILSGLLMVSFWWGRNWILLGNPLFPVTVPIVGPLLGWAEMTPLGSDKHFLQFEWVRSPIEWLAYPWIEWHKFQQNWKHSSGLGMFFAAVFPAALVGGLIGLATPTIAQKRLLGILLGFVAICTLVWWATTSREPRYWLPTIIFLVPLAAIVFGQLRPRPQRAINHLLLAGTVSMLSLFLLREAVTFGDRLVYSRHFERHQALEYPPAIDSLPVGSVVGNLGARSWHYALAGEKLSNQVISSLLMCEALTGSPTSGTSKCGSVEVDASGQVFRSLKVTHLYSDGEVKIRFIDGTRLEIVEAKRVNPTSSVPYELPRILYEIVYPD